MIRQTDNLSATRSGQTLIELVMAMSAATMLMVGLSSALLISTQAFEGQPEARVRARTAAVQSDMLKDVRQATGFTTKTATSVTFTVPDRDGDTLEETITYDWDSGNATLNYIYNGSPSETLLTDVNSFDLSYLTRSLTGSAPTPPALDPNSWGNRWILPVTHFGYDTQFANSRADRRKQIGTRATLSENGTVQSITAYFTVAPSGSSDIRYAIYDVNHNDEPDALIVSSNLVSISSTGWHTISVPQTLLIAGEYYICLGHKSNDASYHFDDSAGGETHVGNSDPTKNNSNFKSTWPGSGTKYEPRRVSIYATYEPE